MSLNEKPPVRKTGSLRTFMLVTIGLAVVFFFAVIIGIFSLNMDRLLRNAETDHVYEQVCVVKGALQTALENLHSNTRTWSSWDEMYDYVSGGNENFIEEQYLSDGTMLAVYNVDFVLIKDKDGRDLFKGSKFSQDSPKQPFPEGLSERIGEISRDVIANYNEQSEFTEFGPYCDAGFVVSGGQSYLLCVMPVVRSEEAGAAAGTFTFIVVYNDEQIKKLTNLQDSRFTIIENDDGYAAGEVYGVTGENMIEAAATLRCLGSGREILLRFEHPRTLYTNGMSLINTASLLLLGASVLLGAFLIFILERFNMRPLRRLVSDVRNISEGSDFDTRPYESKQEYKTLAGAINDMLGRLRLSREAEEQSIISLSVLKNILNGLDAYLYVSDHETDEILFVNDKMLQHFGVVGDCVGETCWRVFQDGFTGRCDFCANFELSKNPDAVVVWEEHNTVTGNYYKNTDSLIEWVDGKKVHLQHSVDITNIKLAEIALEERFRQQELMTEISRRFISSDDTDTFIAEALKMTGEFMGLGQILVFRHDSAAQMLTCDNEWRNPMLALPGKISASLPLGDTLRGVVMRAAAEKLFCLDSNDPMFREELSKYDSSFPNYLVSLIFIAGELYGTVNFCKIKEDEPWTESEINLVKLLTSFLSGVIDKGLMELELKRISSIVKYSPDFISYLSPGGRINYANPAARKITGYTEEELLEGGLELIYSEEMQKLIRDAYIPNTLATGSDSFELELVRKDGEKRILTLSSFMMGSDDNIGGIAKDITEMRKLEQELIAAKELAEQGSRSKSEFLSRMSHEMRTPMNAIIGMTNIALASPDPEKREYCLEKIGNASRHLLGVINDVLDMSKIEANKFELSCAEFNFNIMLLNVTSVVNFRIEERSQVFSLYIDPKIPNLLIGDEQRLAQVITNLLTNAVKFTPERGHISLSAIIQEDLGDSLRLLVEVTDDGIGITPEQQERLFTSFEQADGSIARRFGGTGLGLAISKRIIELAGGRIWVESEAEKGSKFRFEVTLQKAEDFKGETARMLIKKSDLSVLMVDDDPETREYFRHIMDVLEISCDTAMSGADALEKIDSAEKPYNAVFVDWQMPEMSGTELITNIRESRSDQTIIIMISASAWNEVRDDATSVGIDEFIPKPLFPSIIVDCLNKYLSPPEKERSEECDNETPDFSGKKVLLAEDVDINREIVITVLDGTGIEIDCAENGGEAVRLFNENPQRYDIIFMDIHMPEVDGLEAARMIRSIGTPAATKVPIVAMTANVFREDIEACLAAGMDDHIGKPIDFGELFAKLQKYLGR